MESLFDPSLFISTDYKAINFNYKGFTQSLLSLNSSTTDFDLTGQIIWPAAEFLSQYIIDNSELFKGKTVVELGSGAGLSGLIASQFAQNTYLTDGNDVVMDLLERNRVFCNRNNVLVRKLLWGVENIKGLIKEIPNIDVVIGADVLFWPDSIEALVLSLLEIKKVFPKVLTLISLCNRAISSDNTFIKHLKEVGLDRKVVIQEKNLYLYEIIEISP